MRGTKVIICMLQWCIILGMVLLVCGNAGAVDLTGVWKGSGFNKTHNVGAGLEVELVHKGHEITGTIDVANPLYGDGKLKGWVDIEKGEFWAAIKCKELVFLLMGGAKVYLENCSLEMEENVGTGRLVGKIRGDFRYDFGWAKDSVGTFVLSRVIQEGFEGAGTAEENTSPVYTTKHSNVYHKSYCPKLGLNTVEFDSPYLARGSGGVPCEDCNP